MQLDGHDAVGLRLQDVRRAGTAGDEASLVAGVVQFDRPIGTYGDVFGIGVQSTGLVAVVLDDPEQEVAPGRQRHG